MLWPIIKEYFYSKKILEYRIFVFTLLIASVLTPRTSFPSQDFSFSEIHRSVNSPESYSLGYFNTNHIPDIVKEDYQKEKIKSKLFNEIKLYLNHHLIEKLEEPTTNNGNKLEFTGEDNGKKYELTVLKENIIDIKKDYYIVQYKTKQSGSATENFFNTLLSSNKKAKPMSFTAGLIIFPQSKNNKEAFIYLFSRWTTLYNPYAQVKNWGLSITASEDISFQQGIKSTIKSSYLDPNPTTSTEKKDKFTDFKQFRNEIGSEKLRKLIVLPKYQKDTIRGDKNTITGGDSIQFSIKQTIKEEDDDDEEDDITTHHRTVGSLYKMASYFHDIYSSNKIHKEILPFIEQPITDKDTISELNDVLNIKLEKNLSLFAPSKEIYTYFGSKNIYFPITQNNDNKNFQLAIKDKNFNSMLKAKKNQSGTVKKIHLARFVDSIPFEYDSNFYYLNSGEWYQVNPSRLEKMKQHIRRNKSHSEDIVKKYPVYQKDKFKKEADYNLAIVESINTDKPSHTIAVLLDCVNFVWEGNDKFEFADVAIYNNQQWELIHVKLAKANQFDHHLEQVRRCAEFLNSELSKLPKKEYVINAIYNRIHKDIHKKNKIKKDTDKCHDCKIPPKITNKRKRNLKDISENLRSYELTMLKDERISENTKEAYRLITENLLQDGIFHKTNRKRTTIVLAIIDDRKENTPLIKMNQLWNLYDTKIKVENRGFNFRIDVIHEKIKSDQKGNIIFDAFGEVTSDPIPTTSMYAPTQDNATLTSSDTSSNSSEDNDLYSDGEEQTHQTLDELIKNVKQVKKNCDLDLSTVTKIPDEQGNVFYTIPTAGDGDCFFHAIFTQQNSDLERMKDISIEKRNNLIHTILQNKEHLKSMKHLLLEECRGICSASEVSSKFLDFYKEKMNWVKWSPHRKQATHRLYNSFKENKDIDTLLKLIPDNDVKSYTEHLRVNTGNESYIPTRADMICPAQIVCSLDELNINIYTYNQSKEQLDLYKIIQSGEEKSIIHILLHNNHYTRLYDINNKNEYLVIKQIFDNQESLSIK